MDDGDLLDTVYRCAIKEILVITSDWSFSPSDPRATYTSEISLATYTQQDMRPMRLSMLAQWPQREAAGIADLPEDAQVAAYYLFVHYKAQAGESRRGQEATLRDGQFARWTRLLAHYSSEARLGLTLSKLKALASESLAGS